MGRAPDVDDLARVHEVVERSQRLFGIDVERRPVQLVEVDVIGPQATQRGLTRLDDVAPRGAALIAVTSRRQAHLRCEHDVVAPSGPGEHLADDAFALTPRVHVGGVHEVDSCVQGGQ